MDQVLLALTFQDRPIRVRVEELRELKPPVNNQREEEDATPGGSPLCVVGGSVVHGPDNEAQNDGVNPFRPIDKYLRSKYLVLSTQSFPNLNWIGEIVRPARDHRPYRSLFPFNIGNLDLQLGINGRFLERFGEV